MSLRSEPAASYEILRVNMKHYMHGRPLKNPDSELKHLEDFFLKLKKNLKYSKKEKTSDHHLNRTLLSC